MLRSKLCVAAILACCLLTVPAYAGLLGATVDASVDLGIGFALGDGTCKSAAVTGVVVGPGLEVQVGDYTGGCRGYVTVDVLDNQIIVIGRREDNVGDYRWMMIELDFSGASAITGVSLVSQTLFQPGDDDPTPVIGFTSSHISLSWYSGGSLTTIFNLAEGGSSEFDIPTGQIPEPGSMSLLGAGLLGILAVYRKFR